MREGGRERGGEGGGREGEREGWKEGGREGGRLRERRSETDHPEAYTPEHSTRMYILTTNEQHYITTVTQYHAH